MRTLTVKFCVHAVRAHSILCTPRTTPHPTPHTPHPLTLWALTWLTHYTLGTAHARTCGKVIDVFGAMGGTSGLDCGYGWEGGCVVVVTVSRDDDDDDDAAAPPVY